jgi:hypothetical protein
MPGVCVKPAVGAVDHHVVCDEFAKVLDPGSPSRMMPRSCAADCGS